MQVILPKYHETHHPECLNSSSRLLVCSAESGRVLMPMSILVIPPTCHCSKCRNIRETENRCTKTLLNPVSSQSLGTYAEYGGNYDSKPVFYLLEAGSYSKRGKVLRNMSVPGSSLITPDKYHNIFRKQDCTLSFPSLNAQQWLGCNYRSYACTSGLHFNFHTPLPFQERLLFLDGRVSRSKSAETSTPSMSYHMNMRTSNSAMMYRQNKKKSSYISGADYFKLSPSQVRTVQDSKTSINTNLVARPFNNCGGAEPAHQKNTHNFNEICEPFKPLELKATSHTLSPCSSAFGSEYLSSELTKPEFDFMKDKSNLHGRFSSFRRQYSSTLSRRGPTQVCRRIVKKHPKCRDPGIETSQELPWKTIFLKPVTQDNFVYNRSKKDH